MSAVERVRLAPELEVSRLLTGLWQVADQERAGVRLDPDDAARALEPGVLAGCTTLDVADHYGSAELIAGALRRRRGEVEVLTKWVPRPGVSSREEVESAVGRALARIGVPRLDLLQFHAWNYADPSWLDCLFHLEEQRERGRIRHLGVTNFDAAHLDLALRSGIRIVSNQVCCSLLDRRPQGAMTEVCREHGVRLLAYGALAGGLLAERWLGKPAPDLSGRRTWSEMKYLRFVAAAGGWERFQGLLETARRVAARLGACIATVACRFVLDQPEVAGIIVGARPGGRSHLRENLRVFDLALDDRARAELREAQARLDEIPGDCGDEYRRPPYLTASGDLHHHVSHFPPPFAARSTERGRELAEAGFAEASRVGDRLRLTGVLPVHRGRVIGGGDAAAQTRFAFDRIAGALASLDADPAAILRTRIRARRPEDREPVAEAHRRFTDRTAGSVLVETGPLRHGPPGALVEISVEATAASARAAPGAASSR